MEKHESCQFDKLVLEENEVSDTFCNVFHAPPSWPIITRGSSIDLKFLTDGTGQKKGFLVKFRQGKGSVLLTVRKASV